MPIYFTLTFFKLAEQVMERVWNRADVERLLGHDKALLAELVDRLTPIVQARVARALLRRGDLRAFDVRAQVEDLSQEVFLSLLSGDGKILRSWDPQRGLSLESYVGFVAERQVGAILRTGKRNPWKEDPTLDSELDRAAPQVSQEQTIVARDVLHRLLRRMEEQLSPLGRRLFELLYLRERSVAEVESEVGMSPDAIYAWRSRLRRLARQLLAELTPEAPVGLGGRGALGESP